MCGCVFVYVRELLLSDDSVHIHLLPLKPSSANDGKVCLHTSLCERRMGAGEGQTVQPLALIHYLPLHLSLFLTRSLSLSLSPFLSIFVLLNGTIFLWFYGLALCELKVGR